MNIKKMPLANFICFLVLFNSVVLGVLFAVMLYNFAVTNVEIIENQDLIKNITATNLMNTFVNKAHIQGLYHTVNDTNLKIDKLLNASK